MKTKILLLLLTVSLSTYAQREQEVLQSDSLIFYGWDFSQLHLVDEKYLGTDMTTQVLEWVNFCQQRATEEWLSNKFQKKVTVNFTPTADRARKVNGSKVVAPTKTLINKDSLQAYVNAFDFPDKSGIGVIVFLECFEKPTKTTSGYYTFIDLSSKEIMLADYFSGREVDGYGLTKYWGISIMGTHNVYTSNFRKKLKNLAAED
ncbi:MAG TPA: hypothetical protein PKL31_14845 [Fulvivirga sp.]|nr:hypothetical protein [Fulvivirga sp.]